MRAWGRYVSEHHPSVEQEFKVQKTFDVYKQSQLTLLDAAIAYKGQTNVVGAQAQLDRAVATAGAALTDLTSLLVKLGVKLEE